MASSYMIAPGQSAEDLAMRKKLALALMQQGTDTSPVQHWTQGAARLASALAGGIDLARLEKKDESDKASAREIMAGMLSGGAPSATPPSPPANQPATDTTLPRGLRNNNPLNIEAGAFTEDMPGYQGSDGRFARFASMDDGTAAADKLLNTYNQKHGLNTVGGIVGRWAPSNDGNNVSAYAANVSKQLGVAPDAQLDMANPEFRKKLIAAMAQHENGMPIPTRGAPGTQMAQAPQAAAPAAPGGVNRDMLVKMLQNRYTAPMAQQIMGDLVKKQFIPREPEYVPVGDNAILDKKSGRVSPVPIEKKTDDIREYEAAVKQGFKGSLQEFMSEMKRAGSPKISIDQRAPDEFEKEYGQGLGKRALQTIEAGDNASMQYQRIQLLRSLNNSIKTGKLTPATATVGGYMQSMGLDPKIVGIDPNLPANAETMMALSNEMVLGKLGSGGFPTQNFSNTDRTFLEKTVTSVADRPEANEMKLAVAERIAQLQMEKADRWAEARSKKVGYEDFEREWRKELKSRDIFSDLQEQMPGTTPPPGSTGRVRKFNPATGKIE